MYFREQQIAEAVRRYPINEVRCFSQSQAHTSVFLSHKHTERTLMLQIKSMLEHIGIDVYIDWLDETMTSTTSGKTAKKLKEKIKLYDKFVLVATNGAIVSKWCNWELGLGDAEKYSKDKIAILPIVPDYDYQWEGAEYLQIYPSIEYQDGSTTYSNGAKIPEGYYVLYPSDSNGMRIIVKLTDWLRR